MAKKLNLDRAAMILVEAAYYGDKKTAEKHGISERTISNYRSRLAEDGELSVFFHIKKQEFEDKWADELPAAIRAGIQYLAKAANEADPKDPKAIYSIAGALKILADVALTKKVLDARITGRGEPERTEVQQMARTSAASEHG